MGLCGVERAEQLCHTLGSGVADGPQEIGVTMSRNESSGECKRTWKREGGMGSGQVGAEVSAAGWPGVPGAGGQGHLTRQGASAGSGQYRGGCARGSHRVRIGGCGDSGHGGRIDRRLRLLIGGDLTISLRGGRREGLVGLEGLAEHVLGRSNRRISRGEFPAEALGQGIQVVA